MKSSRATAKSFALRYFGKAPGIRTTAALRRKAQHITTIIVDTDNLTSGAVSFDRAIPLGGSTSSVVAMARRALANNEGPLTAALEATPVNTAVKSFSGQTLGAVYHHGESFTSVWVGKPTTLAHHAGLTDTEQERLLLQARKLAAHGSIVYAVAEASSIKVPTSLKDVTVKIVGLLLFHPQLYHGTEEAVARIREANKRIIYVSKDPEHTVLQFATLSLITNQSSVPFVYRPGRALPKSAACYAALSDDTRAEVVAQFPKESTLIVEGPLPDFWQGLSALLG